MRVTFPHTYTYGTVSQQNILPYVAAPPRGAGARREYPLAPTAAVAIGHRRRVIITVV